jgi:hypothetical protein
MSIKGEDRNQTSRHAASHDVLATLQTDVHEQVEFVVLRVMPPFTEAIVLDCQ